MVLGSSKIWGDGILASNHWASLRNLGPGLLFAGMAIGTSHLVQSTRAGAVFGLGLAGVILLANVAKYPAFRFGAQYAAATGETLISVYRRIGLAPVIFLLAVFVFAHGFSAYRVKLTPQAPSLLYNVIESNYCKPDLSKGRHTH